MAGKYKYENGVRLGKYDCELEYQKRYYSRTAIYPPHRFTKEECELVLTQKMPDHELSKLIGHSVKSIQVKRCKLKGGYEASNGYRKKF